MGWQLWRQQDPRRMARSLHCPVSLRQAECVRQRRQHLSIQLVLTSAWGFARDSLVYLKPRMPVSLSTPRYPGFSEGPWQIQPPKFWTNCPTEKWDGGFEGQMDAVTDHTGRCQSHSWVRAGSPVRTGSGVEDRSGHLFSSPRRLDSPLIGNRQRL